MEIKERHIAEIKNNIDPLHEGRVQIDVPELFHGDIPATELPWARPDRSNTCNIPRSNDNGIMGEYVWAWMLDFENKKHWYYGNKVSLKEYNDCFKDATIKSKIALLLSMYPDLEYTYEKNGVIIGHSKNLATPEIFLINGSSYIFIDSLGNITVKGTSVTISGATDTVVPSAIGCLNSIKICPFVALPHTGKTVS